jgi:uncharacterized membrane protein YhaH (DUF805 family)
MRLNRLIAAESRLSRGQFWLQAMCVWLLLYGARNLLGAVTASVVVWIVNGAALAVLMILCIRRLHDRNYSGWWLLVILVPVAGAAWLVWQTAFRRGVPQGNRWGEDPAARHGDYLVVQ